jgi:hypothetical protein
MALSGQFTGDGLGYQEADKKKTLDICDYDNSWSVDALSGIAGSSYFSFW